MTRTELIAELSQDERIGTKRKAQEFLKTLVTVLTEQLQKGEKVTLDKTFGTFSTKTRKGTTIKTKTPYSTKIVRFKQSQTLKRQLNIK